MRLLRALRQLQDSQGYLTHQALEALAAQENVPLYRLQSLVSFFPHFRTKPPASVEVAVCRDMCCWLAGGGERGAELRQELAGLPGVDVHPVSCLGRCDMAPAGAIAGQAVSLADLRAVKHWCQHPGDLPPAQARFEQAWPSDPYADISERFELLRELLRQPRDLAAARVLTALKDSGLGGMGGAGFPTAMKWELVRNQGRTPKFVICNADESEPGTFKDRVILSELSHLVVEGMILAGLVTGAQRGILFVRHEYAPEQQAFEKSLDAARQAGLLGSNILGTGFDFDLEIFVSPGGYILGEETALLETLEDKRGQPRNKPPYPGTHGLNGQPTLINNVETLALVPGIVRRGAEWWKAQGKRGCRGRKFFALSGQVERPGVFDLPLGTTVRELIALGGGMKDGRPFKAFSPGGASSPFLPASLIDLPLDFGAVAQAGSMLGTGAVFIVAEGTDMLALATNIVRFFRNESCGECVPCRVGTQKAVELLELAPSNPVDSAPWDVLPQLGETLNLTSLCGLGQIALNPILSVMKHWPDECGKRP